MTYPIHPLTEDEKRRRKAGSDVMEDGEYLHFASILMRDEASSGNSVFLTDAPAGSIDAALKAAIEQKAKSEGLKPSQWLANRNSKQLEDFVAGVAQAHVATLTPMPNLHRLVPLDQNFLVSVAMISRLAP